MSETTLISLKGKYPVSQSQEQKIEKLVEQQSTQLREKLYKIMSQPCETPDRFFNITCDVQVQEI